MAGRWNLVGVSVKAVPLKKLQPAPWNPRTIRDERFKNLCASIEADPDFLWRRPVLAQADGTIYAGNMRYRAAEHLGLAAIPAVVEDIPDALAKERALRDNAQWGDWNDDQLAEMVYQMAADGSDVKLLASRRTNWRGCWAAWLRSRFLNCQTAIGARFAR
jgi:ParB-like chromosome segregation protein Spo0J